MSNILDIMSADEATNAEFAPTATTNTNLVLTKGKVCEFAATLPQWGEGASLDDEPVSVVEFTAGIDLRNAEIVLTGANAYLQPRGGRAGMATAQAENREPDWMTQIGLSVSCLGARLVIKDTDNDEWVPHYMHTSSAYSALGSRALELFLTTPFTVTDAIIEQVRQSLLAQKFQARDYTRSANNARREIFNLTAAYPDGVTASNRIRTQQRNGLMLSELSIQGPRREDEHDPFYNITEQLRFAKLWLSGIVASGQEITRRDESRAYSLVTCLTGVNRAQSLESVGNGQDAAVANRSTVQNITALSPSVEVEVPGRGAYIIPGEAKLINFYEGLENNNS